MRKGRKSEKLNIFAARNWLLPRILMMIVAIWSVGFSAYIVYAKYYSVKSNKAVMVASNLYFNSDKLKQKSGVTDLDTILANTDFVNALAINTNSANWNSGNVLMQFDIRNYDNNILYNSANLDVDYKVEFVLLDEPQGATYWVNTGGDSYQELAAEGSRITSTGTVYGGSLDADSYGIRVNLTGTAESYVPSRVLVLAYPTAPDYMYQPADAMQPWRLVGVFQAHVTETKMTIESSHFKVTEETDYSDTTWKAKVQNLSGYIYNIKTAGDVVMDTSTANSQEAKITWDTNYVAIDEYDENYIYAQNHGLIEENGSKKTMTILVLPYTSIDITFYKTSAFDAAVAAKGANEEGRLWFEGLVTATIPEE